jgi:hypothetical protein
MSWWTPVLFCYGHHVILHYVHRSFFVPVIWHFTFRTSCIFALRTSVIFCYGNLTFYLTDIMYFCFTYIGHFLFRSSSNFCSGLPVPQLRTSWLNQNDRGAKRTSTTDVRKKRGWRKGTTPYFLNNFVVNLFLG